MKFLPHCGLLQRLAQFSVQTTGWALNMGLVGALVFAWLLTELVFEVGDGIIRVVKFMSNEAHLKTTSEPQPPLVDREIHI